MVAYTSVSSLALAGPAAVPGHAALGDAGRVRCIWKRIARAGGDTGGRRVLARGQTIVDGRERGIVKQTVARRHTIDGHGRPAWVRRVHTLKSVFNT